MEELARFYQTIYIIIVLLLTAVYANMNNRGSLSESKLSAITLCSFMVLFIGLRPVHDVFADSVGYAYVYENSMHINEFIWSTTGSVIFEYLTSILSLWGVPTNVYFLILSILYFVPMLVVCTKLFPRNTMMAFLVFLAAFSTFSYGVNGIRAGIGGSLFLLALVYQHNKLIMALLMFVSWGFHHSMSMVIPCYMITLFFKNHKWFFYGWLLCLVLSLAHVTYFQDIFAEITNDKGAGYLNGESGWDGKVGFRYDFVAYSSVPIIIGYFVKFKYHLADYYYDNLLNMYLITNGIWLLCMYAGFTNRIAYLSWFMYPILLIYPFLTIRNNQHPLVINRVKVIWGHIFFTVFMMIYTSIR